MDAVWPGVVGLRTDGLVTLHAGLHVSSQVLCFRRVDTAEGRSVRRSVAVGDLVHIAINELGRIFRAVGTESAVARSEIVIERATLPQ